VDLHFDAAVGHAEVAEQVQGGDGGGVLGEVFREFALVAGDLGDAQSGFIGMADDDFIAGGMDGETQDIIAAGDIRHGGWGEHADFRGVGHGGVKAEILKR
jgi:hypothetical protein